MDDNVLSASSPHNFTDLQNTINDYIANNPDATTPLELQYNYTYDEDADESIFTQGMYIIIDGKITINGNGAVLDANNKVGMLDRLLTENILL